MTRLIQISVEVDAEVAEAVCELFNRLNSRDWDADARDLGAGGGAVIEGTGFPDDTDLVPDAIDLTLARSILVKTFVPVGNRAEELQQQIVQGLWWLSRLHPMPEPQITLLDDKDWQEAWKEHYASFRVGANLVIQPIWEEPVQTPCDVVLRLNPGMAFGTGLHPSTQLSLVLLERYGPERTSLLDVGTGSGILAIAAAKLGMSFITGTDTDPLALQVAAENARHNAIERMAGVTWELYEGSLPPVGGYDIVVVNILPSVIVRLLKHEGLEHRLNDNGILILSGIIEERAAEVEVCLEERGITVLEKRTQEDWVAFVAQTA